MIIAINTCTRVSHFAVAGNAITRQLATALASHFPQYRFVLLTADAAVSGSNLAGNISLLPVTPPPASTLLWRYWYQYTLPAILRKQRATLFISTDGCCALRTRIPQVLLLPDADRDAYPQFFPGKEQRFFKKNTAAFLSKAARVLVHTAADKTRLLRRYGLKDSQVAVTGYAIPPAFRPLTEEEKAAVKEKYTAGREYFLFAGKLDAAYEVINLLKAFSFFKKRQKSNMRLLLLANEIPAGFTAQFNTYKFRDEVSVLTALPAEEKAAILGAAYIFVYPAACMPGHESYPLAAMQCGVPVIAGNPAFYTERWGEAAVYSNATDVADLAQKMMWLYKDENQYKKMVHAGNQLAATHSAGCFSSRVAEIIEDLISSQTP